MTGFVLTDPQARSKPGPECPRKVWSGGDKPANNGDNPQELRRGEPL
ncbi:MAG: hypothetical protein QOJ15_7153 [Bradyrhizobium sp.]|nr:hypothetical protein [Bradyrhizobium sp.]